MSIARRDWAVVGQSIEAQWAANKANASALEIAAA